MVDFKDATKKLRAHFGSSGSAEFVKNVKEFCPELCDTIERQRSSNKGEIAMSQLTLFTTNEADLPLDAYLASALTGLDEDRRSLVFDLSYIVGTVCKKHAISLYEPRKVTDPVYNADIPDGEVFRKDRERVLKSDLLIYLSLFPSTGAGEELDFAYSALVPIIIVSRSSDNVSRMVTGIPSFRIHLQYEEPEQLNARLDECLTTIRPILEERRLAYSEHDVNIVGDRIRSLREQLQLTRKDLAESVVPELTEEALRQIEESADRVSNPSLIHLRQIAAVLKTTVADLVEPDMTANVIRYLQDWIEGRQAARFGGISQRDRNRILRRLLLRIIDSLESD